MSCDLETRRTMPNRGHTAPVHAGPADGAGRYVTVSLDFFEALLAAHEHLRELCYADDRGRELHFRAAADVAAVVQRLATSSTNLCITTYRRAAVEVSPCE